jgi:REP element-mobilizing transposase RayT
MKFDPEKHRRRSIRLKGADYSLPGAYFITICAQDRECIFGEIVDGKIELNDAGKIALQCLHEIPEHYPYVVLDAFIVMPNHVHGILFIVGANNHSPKMNDPDIVRANNHSPLQRPYQRPTGTSKTIGAIVRGYKIGVTKWFRANTKKDVAWQRNYYEHIIRNEEDLNRIREYIMNNPLNWNDDDLFHDSPLPYTKKTCSNPLSIFH